MPPKKNPLKLNKLQLRTLALVQAIAADPEMAHPDKASGETTLLRLPHAHGDHLHIGQCVVSTGDASGFDNAAVLRVLTGKGLVRRDDPLTMTITVAGLEYDTGLGEKFMAPSDH